MEIKNLSQTFNVKKLTESNIDDMLALCEKNTFFFEYCPPAPTKKSLLEDLSALPPNKTLEDKFFVGFYDKNKLVAICDLISGYPHAQTAFIGLFMLDKALQGQGLGTKMLNEMFAYLKKSGFKKVELSYIKGNPQSRAFWHKNGFKETGREVEMKEYTKVCMERFL